ncbi:hypothetical protein [Neobacillus drentensis]|uniref:hypothetical protein n=1 Tax=Neobacillus drentensis TaxID=220684 RepID=UPI003000B522
MRQLRKEELREKKFRAETVQLSIDVPQHIRDNFLEALEKSGKTINDVLKLYMQKYAWKQGELQRNRQKRRQDLC